MPASVFKPALPAVNAGDAGRECAIDGGGVGGSMATGGGASADADRTGGLLDERGRSYASSTVASCDSCGGGVVVLTELAGLLQCNSPFGWPTADTGAGFGWSADTLMTISCTRVGVLARPASGTGLTPLRRLLPLRLGRAARDGGAGKSLSGTPDDITAVDGDDDADDDG
jgi:hypothetical protein